MSNITASDRARMALLGSVIVTVLLYVVPYGELLAWPLVLLSRLTPAFCPWVVSWMVWSCCRRSRSWRVTRRSR